MAARVHAAGSPPGTIEHVQRLIESKELTKLTTLDHNRLHALPAWDSLGALTRLSIHSKR
jgi:hypothetical protein